MFNSVKNLPLKAGRMLPGLPGKLHLVIFLFVVSGLPAAPPVPEWLAPVESSFLVNYPKELTVSTEPIGGTTLTTSVEFYADGLPLGTAVAGAGNEWTINWFPRIIGDFSLQAKALDSNGEVTWSQPLFVSVEVNPATGTAFYAGGQGEQELMDVNELSDGTLLLAGSASNLDWLPLETPITTLIAPELTDSGTGRYPILIHLSADMETILHVCHLPKGYAANFRWIRSTNIPGERTGMIYLSGEIAGGYFIGRLDQNFLENNFPSGFDWTFLVEATNGHETDQPWDVGNDGRVVYAYGGEYDAQIGFLSPDGERKSLPSLRASHKVNGEYQRGVGNAFPNAEFSAIRLPTDNQSWNDEELFAITPDGNGGIRQGTWPIDIMVVSSFETGEPINFIDGRKYGYNGYRPEGRHWIGAVTIDRRNNHFYYGFNIKSVLAPANGFGENPDFEPAVIGYDADGQMKWWSRLYTEAADTDGDGSIDTTWRSEPDQYIDSLNIDYSQAQAEEEHLIVAARSHGNNASNYWAGNKVAANPEANGFQSRVTGTEGNIHVTWIGRLNGSDGTLLNATWITGYFRNVSQNQELYKESIHDGWPSHNSGWYDLTSTWSEKGSLRVGTDGRIYTVGIGPRMVTTFNAFQKLPRQSGSVFEGHSPWSAFVRVLEPDLSKLAYSSALAGIWTRDENFTALGADNLRLNGVYPTQNGVFVVGHSRVESDGSIKGNAMPVANVPAWGMPTADGVSGILGRLSFGGGPNVPPDVTLIEPEEGVLLEPGTSLVISANPSDYDGTVQRVEFYVGEELVDTRFGEAYSFEWTAPDIDGTYSISARVFDDQDASNNSASREVTVFQANRPPVVSIDGPVDGETVPRGTTANITVSATDAEGFVSRVELLANGESIGVLTSAPWSFIWSPPAGVYSLVARATDNENAWADSESVEFTVGGPPVAQTIAINFRGNLDILDETGTGGFYWNSTDGAGFNVGPLLTTDGLTVSNVSISTETNPFGFVNAGRGAALISNHAGYNFPVPVTQSYLADNTSSGRNSSATIRFFTQTPASYVFTILSSYANGDPADNQQVSGFNVGGTYSTATRTFSGGETLVLDSGKGTQNWSAGSLGPVQTTAVSGGYEVVVNAGQINGGLYLNGMVVELTPTYSNHPPVAVAAGVDPAFAIGYTGTSTVSLDASSSYDPDSGDSIFAYRWYNGDTLIGTGPTPAVTLPEGSHTLTLVVLDEFFDEGTTGVPVTVLPTPGNPPVVAPMSNSPGVDTDNDGIGQIILDGTGSYDSDEGDEIVKYGWYDGETLIAEGAVVEVSLPVGTRTIGLQVEDNRGWRASEGMTVEILPAPGRAPVAVAPDDFIVEDSDDNGSEAVSLDGTTSYDPDGDEIISYEWLADNESIGTGATTVLALPLGVHELSLVVTDEWNKSSQSDFTVTVVRPPLVAPIANPGPDFSVRDLNDNGSEEIQLDGSASYDPVGRIGVLAYKWLLGDELLATGKKPHVTLPIGSHTLTLSVRDDDNLWGSETFAVTVFPALQGPVKRIALALANNDIDDRSSGGAFWNGIPLSLTDLELLDTEGQTTDVSLEVTESFSFSSPDRGSSLSVNAAGVTVPTAVLKSYLGNTFGSGNTGHASFRLTSNREYRIRVTAISSVAYQDPEDGIFLGEINTGGQWGGSSNRSFEGGESIFVDAGKGPLNYDISTSFGWLPTESGPQQVLDIGFGSISSDNSDGIRLNAIILELTDLTESEPSGFDAWINLYSDDIPVELRGPLDDASGDGISNLLAYARGLDPREYISGSLRNTLQLNPESESLVVALKIQNGLTRSDLNYRILYSEDLNVWNPVAEARGSSNFLPVGSKITSIEPKAGEVIFTLEGGNGFVKLEVEFLP